MIASLNGRREQPTSIIAKVAAARDDVGQTLREARQAAAQRFVDTLLGADQDAASALIQVVLEPGTDIPPGFSHDIILDLVKRTRHQQAAACKGSGQVEHAQHVAPPVAEVAA